MTETTDHIRTWQSRLTGLPEETFTDKSLQDKLDLIAQWHTSKVIAEQMVVLTIAQAMEEDGVSEKDLAHYFMSTEVKETGIGRFNYVSGIATWPGRVKKAFMLIIRSLGYRPYIPYETALSIASIVERPGAVELGLTPANVCDTLFKKFLSPHVQRKTLQTLKQFMKSQPEAAAQMMRAMAEVREQGAKVVADIDEVEDRVESFVPSDAPD